MVVQLWMYALNDINKYLFSLSLLIFLKHNKNLRLHENAGIEITGLLGQGGFGSVYRIKYENLEVAMKEVFLNILKCIADFHVTTNIYY